MLVQVCVYLSFSFGPLLPHSFNIISALCGVPSKLTNRQVFILLHCCVYVCCLRFNTCVCSFLLITLNPNPNSFLLLAPFTNTCHLRTNIQNVIVICTENHSFDSYLGSWCKAPTNSAPSCNTPADQCEWSLSLSLSLSLSHFPFLLHSFPSYSRHLKAVKCRPSHWTALTRMCWMIRKTSLSAQTTHKVITLSLFWFISLSFACAFSLSLYLCVLFIY